MSSIFGGGATPQGLSGAAEVAGLSGASEPSTLVLRLMEDVILAYVTALMAGKRPTLSLVRHFTTNVLLYSLTHFDMF